MIETHRVTYRETIEDIIRNMQDGVIEPMVAIACLLACLVKLEAEKLEGEKT